MTMLRAAVLLLLLCALWFQLTMLAGCAMKLPQPAMPPRTIFLAESVPPETRVCVLQSPFLDGSFTCIRVEDLRALLRSKQMARR